MSGRLLLTFVMFLAASAVLVAQNVTVIETRGQPISSPTLRIMGGRGAGGGTPKVFRVTFSTPDASHLQVGEPFDYDVVITNIAEKDILVPQSPYWSDVIDGSQAEHRYTELALSFGFTAEDGSRAFVDGHVILYGLPSKAGTMLTLHPGDSIRILGTAVLSPNWDKKQEGSLVKTRMEACVGVNATKIHPAQDSAAPDAYRSDERQIYWAQSENRLDVELAAN